MTDRSRILGEVLKEADELIRRRLEELGLKVSHLVIGATPEGEVVLHSNVSPDVLRSFGEDLLTFADDITNPPEPGDTTH